MWKIISFGETWVIPHIASYPSSVSISNKKKKITAVDFEFQIEYGIVSFWFWNAYDSSIRQNNNRVKFFNFR